MKNVNIIKVSKQHNSSTMPNMENGDLHPIIQCFCVNSWVCLVGGCDVMQGSACDPGNLHNVYLQ